MTEPAEESHDSPAPRRNDRRLWFLAALLIIVAAWFAGLLGAFVGAKLAERVPDPPRRPSTLGLTTAPPRTDPLPAFDVAKAAAIAGPSVVAVQSIIVRDQQRTQAIGTGVVLTTDGEIVTNSHVVHGAESVNVRLAGETEPRRAVVLADDPGRDLALLRIGATGLTPATFAAPGDIRLGDEVLAIGFALDLDGDPSVTLGIVSGLDRTLATGSAALKGLIQTDAAISSGNSGGPLVNALGQVVGIDTLVALSDAGSAANNVGFAISTAELLPEITLLRGQAQGTPISSGFLGVRVVKRDDGGTGALVVDVAPGSPAAAAGIRTGDVVTAVNGAPIDGQAALVATIRGLAPGATVAISLRRDGAAIDVHATLVVLVPDTTPDTSPATVTTG